MAQILNFEDPEFSLSALPAHDIFIVGGGAAGLTLARELARKGMKVCVLESGDLQETPEHEALNAVDGRGELEDADLQQARQAWHGPQLRFWTSQVQKFGVRCRVLGGSTAAWAGKVAPFDPVDYARRDWIAESGWPFDKPVLAPYLDRAAAYLDLGPLVHDDSFWSAAGRAAPAPLGKLRSFTSFFWQFARSRLVVTDVMRIGDEFRATNPAGVTVLLNATVQRIVIKDGSVTGLALVSSRDGARRETIATDRVVIASGAIENARLLLLSGVDQPGVAQKDGLPAIGHYLMDHPTVRIGHIRAENREDASRFLGFFPLRQGYRIFMYAHGLTLSPAAQQQHRLPNMAIFGSMVLSKDDPLLAVKRLMSFKSEAVLRDFATVAGNVGLVFTGLGRKVLESSKVPTPVKRMMTDAAVWLNANFVARDYLADGGGRKMDEFNLEMICEQPPAFDNCITLGTGQDRLGIPRAMVDWKLDQATREAMVKAGSIALAELQEAGIAGVEAEPAIAMNKAELLVPRDMAHTAGTTRMGADPATSVVNSDCQVHGVAGLYVAGASVFPTVGHANPTLVIMAVALRLADHIVAQVAEKTKMEHQALTQEHRDPARPLVLVTGATGNLGGKMVEALLAKGWRVRGQYRHRLPLDPRVEWRQLDFASLDLTDADFDHLLEGVGAVLHFAASLAEFPAEAEASNVINLERLAEACARNGVKYFGQASSMVVYGSPTSSLVNEESPLIDPAGNLSHQYHADAMMRNYARTKRIGEDILARYGDRMKVDLNRIAVAKENELQNALQWGKGRRLFSSYRNSHFIAPATVARAFLHLMERSLAAGATGVDAYNICETGSPSFYQFLKEAEGKGHFHLPLVMDWVKGVKTARSLSLRRPQGAFRMDDAKLRATGFVHHP